MELKSVRHQSEGRWRSRSGMGPTVFGTAPAVTAVLAILVLSASRQPGAAFALRAGRSVVYVVDGPRGDSRPREVFFQEFSARGRTSGAVDLRETVPRNRMKGCLLLDETLPGGCCVAEGD